MLEKIIDDIFVNGKDDVIISLKEFNLKPILEKHIEFINSMQNSSLEDKLSKISSFTSSFLTRVNTVVSVIADEDKKRNIEYILVEITHHLLFTFLIAEKNNSELLLIEVIKSIEITCMTNDWNSEDLLKMLKTNMLQKITASQISSSLLEQNSEKPEALVYYEWQRKERELKDFSEDLKSMNIIKSPRSFEKLFSKHDGQIKVKMNNVELDFIIVLFDQLNKSEIVKMKGGKGHFLPLKKYSVDFENKILIKKEPKHLKERIVKSAMKYNVLKEKVDKLLHIYTPI